MPDNELNQIEKLRISFKPTSVNVLMIAESPPSAGNFFYNGDEFCQHTKQAFQKIGKKFDNPIKFLEYFREKCFYLEDLCHEPVNQLGTNLRNFKRNEGVPRLADDISNWKPKVIICCMKDIRYHVLQAMSKSDLNDFILYTVPYPRQRHITNYINKLADILSKLNDFNIVDFE